VVNGILYITYRGENGKQYVVIDAGDSVLA